MRERKRGWWRWGGQIEEWRQEKEREQERKIWGCVDGVDGRDGQELGERKTQTREIHRDRQTDRQTDRDRQRDIDRERH